MSLTNSNRLIVEYQIVEQWYDGYKVELEITPQEDVKDWKLHFSLPDNYTIREFYGIDISQSEDGNYAIAGGDNWGDLKSGQQINPILIIDRFGIELNNFALDFQQQNNADAGADADRACRNSNDTVSFSDEQQQGQFNYGESLQLSFLFFEANRSGDLPEDNRIEWRSDSTLNDGSDVGIDLEGGYFDAGDHIKFIQPMAFSSTMLAWGGIDYQEAYQQSGQLNELRDAVKWATDWFLKAHETDRSGNTSRLWVQVGDASDHEHWVSPEEIDKVTDRKSYYIDSSRPGSDAAAGTASALASASMLFRGVDDTYASELIKNAIALYEFAETYQGKYSDSVPEASPFYTSYSGYYDELSLGAAWLYKATGEQKYLTKAEDYFKEKIGGLGDWTYAADDHSYAAAMILARESNDPFFKAQYQGWIDTWIEGNSNISYTPDGFPVRAEWASVPLTASSAFAAQWYDDFIEDNAQYSEFATDQIDYILGDNSNNFSYQIGFGDNYPLRPHHRGSARTQLNNDDLTPNDYVLYGGIVGGPANWDPDSYNDIRSDFKTNEVGIGYNAPFTSAVVQQYDVYGGSPLSDSELDELLDFDTNSDFN